MQRLDPLSVHQSFPLLDQLCCLSAVWLLTLLYSLLWHWAKIGGKWGPVILQKKITIHKRKSPCGTHFHPFTTLGFIFRKVIPVSIWKYPFFSIFAWTFKCSSLVCLEQLWGRSCVCICCTWCPRVCSYWDCRTSSCSHLHVYETLREVLGLYLDYSRQCFKGWISKKQIKAQFDLQNI